MAWRRLEQISWNSFFGELEREKATLAAARWPALLLGALAAANRPAAEFAAHASEFREQFRAFLLDGECGELAARRGALGAVAALVLQSRYAQRLEVAAELRALCAGTYSLAAHVVQDVQARQRATR